MTEPAESLLLSASLGALIGLIRQWEGQHGGGVGVGFGAAVDTGAGAGAGAGTPAGAETDFAGLRTFTLVSLLGCASAFVSGTHAVAAFPVALGLLGVLLGVTQARRPASSGQVGYTTPVAAVVAFFVGAMVFWQERTAAVLLSALTVILLGLKQPIHRWTERFTSQDVRSALQFVAITGIILPLVPNRDYGPYAALNPWSTWLMVVLISGLGFFGYILMRLLGPKAGITLTGLVGGLASSTATTLAFSRRSREDPGESESYALAVILACNVMLARVLAIALAISPALARALAVPLAVMAVPGIGYAAWMWLGRRQTRDAVEAPAVTNPLSLGTAVKFALIYAVVKLLVKGASQAGMAQGVVVVSAVAGLTDVDAIAVSLSGGSLDGTLSMRVAAAAVLVGCVSNTVVKAGLAATLGSPALRGRVAGVLGATAVVGIGAVVWLN